MTSIRSLFYFAVSAALALLANATNVIDNGDFQSVDAQGQPVVWYVYSDGSASMGQDTQDVPPGAEQSLRIQLNQTTDKQGTILYKVKKLQDVESYTLEAWMKSSAPRMGMIQVKLFRDGKTIQRINSDRSETEWKKYRMEIPLNGADSMYVLLRYSQDKEFVGQTTSFANIHLSPGSSSTPETSTASATDQTKAPQSEPFSIGEGKAVATFNNAGLYVNSQGLPPEDLVATPRFRKKGQSTWQPGLPLVYHGIDQQFRGSIFHLIPDTEYDVAVDFSRGEQRVMTSWLGILTWPEEPTIGKIVELPPKMEEPLVISQSGEPDGYTLYRPASGHTRIEGGESPDGAVVIKDAAYIIIENLEIRGGAEHGVEITDSHHIRIRRCDVAGWGNPGIKTLGTIRGLYLDEDGKLISNQAGIFIGRGASQIVVENNYIHHPRGTASSWKYGHAAGPEGIHQLMTEGNNVIRDNDIIGAEEHWWNDGFAGSYNKEIKGGMHRDGDAYGNVIAFSNDDGAELDGGQMNVRFYNNWIDHALCGISGAPNRKGPSYYFYNLLILGEERGYGGSAFKMGGSRFEEPGTGFIYNNTALGFSRGISTHYGDGPVPLVTRNNIFAEAERYSEAISFKFSDPMGDFDFDLLRPDDVRVPIAGREANAIIGEPTFVDPAQGDYRLADDSIGVGSAVPLVNLQPTGEDQQDRDLGALPHSRTTALFPDRPDGMSLLPMRLPVTQVQKKPATTGELTAVIPPALGTSWTAYPNSPWLICEPSTGTTSSEPQRLKIKLRNTDMAIREWKGAVTLRTDQGYNRTSMIQVKVFPAEPFTVILESEEANLSGTFTADLESDTMIEYVTATEDENEEAENDKTASTLRYHFSVPTDGIYYAFARVITPGTRRGASQHNSLYYQIDDGEKNTYDAQTFTDKWKWDLVRDSPDTQMVNGGTHTLRGDELIAHLTKERVKLELAAGPHTLTFTPKDSGLWIDKIAISNMPYPDELE